MIRKLMSSAVAAACGALEAAASAGAAPEGGTLPEQQGRTRGTAPELVRQLTVDIRIEARAADDSPLAPLVIEALREFIEASPDTASGKFESKAGLDISWSVRNEYVNAAGEPVALTGG